VVTVVQTRKKKEAFTQKPDDGDEADDEATTDEATEEEMHHRLSELSKKLKKDEAKLNKTLHDQNQLGRRMN
jgi:cell fate (sporulation/competence/biofilm development) regulator YlbF (YheA/YmcA/DUF963 family)